MKSQRVWIFLTRFLAKWTLMSMNEGGETGIFDSLRVAGGVGGDCALVFHFGCVDGLRDLECWELHLHSWLYRVYLLPKEWIDVYS
jgi:hypothetical protein